MFGIAGLDTTPIVYGVVIFVGLASIWYKLTTRRYTAFLLETGVFSLVFWLHGGSMNGGFAAAIAAMLSGLILPKMRLKTPKK